MKYTIVGDSHLTLKSLSKIEKICKMVETLKYPVIWLGDQLDTKSIVQAECLNFWMNYFGNSELEHTLLVGNHDLLNIQTTKSSLEPLSWLKSVTLVETPRAIGNFYLIPYTHSEKELLQAIQQSPKDSVLICHAALDGFDYGTGFIHKGGVGIKDLSKFLRVISGHFHKYQTKGNLTYLGTPFSHSFGETDQTKYIATYDTETDHLELIKTDLPQHRTLEVNCALNTTGIESSQHVIEGWGKDDLIRIILLGTSEDINEYTLPESILKFNPRIIKRPDALLNQEHSISETLSPETQFEGWANSVGNLSDTAIKRGIDFLKEVSK